MRWVLRYLIFFFIGLGASFASVLTPKQASQSLGKTVSLEFKVKGTGVNDAGFFELYSEESWNHPDSFFIRFPFAIKNKFQEINVSIPNHFVGRKIQVKGVVQLLSFGQIKRNVIYVHSTDQIVIVPASIEESKIVGYLPTSQYAVKKIHGFELLIEPSILKKVEYRGLIDEVQSQLIVLDKLLKPETLVELKKVKIWIEWDNKSTGCEAAAFHKDAKWLIQNKLNPDKAGGIEICNLKLMSAWSKQNQPMMMLHEFAHAYQFHFLGDDNVDIKTTYQAAMNAGLYQSVPDGRGGSKRAYAANNFFEYFAELTESYWFKNDYFPFDRESLMAYDPLGYFLMKKIWD